MENEKLITIVFERDGAIDKESKLYRQLVASKLRYSSEFEILECDQHLSIADIQATLTNANSKYVIFINENHILSPNFMPTMFKYLEGKNIYLAEPFMYNSAIPEEFDYAKLNNAYFYNKDTGYYGYIFNRELLLETVDIYNDIDPESLYLTYRVYWSINKVKPLEMGYSVSSVTKIGIGLEIKHEVKRLVPAFGTTNVELRLGVLKLVVLFLKGFRTYKNTAVTFSHLRKIVDTYNLVPLARAQALTLNPFEVGFIEWLADSSNDKFLFNELAHYDYYLRFSKNTEQNESDKLLYRLETTDASIAICREELPKSLNDKYSSPDEYDYYSSPITPDSVLIFVDRGMQADDNAEHLYRYVKENHPEFRNIYFALNQKSPDWERLEAEGFNLVQFFSRDFYQLYLRSDAFISSQTYSPSFKGKTFRNSRFIYLQHGIQLNDMSDWVLSKQFDVFVATGKQEADYLGNLLPKETLNSGIPRLEALLKKPNTQDHILFMPTWRFNLHNLSDEAFMETEFYKSINDFIQSEQLTEHLAKTGKKLLLQLHPNILKRAECFDTPANIEISNLSYGDAIAGSELILTDYSSVVLDGAFIGKPIVYYQWDKEDFFKDQPYENRVDFDQEGLGPVFYSLDNVLQYIVGEEYSTDRELYAQRSQQFFEGVDPTRINERIFNRILEA